MISVVGRQDPFIREISGSADNHAFSDVTAWSANLANKRVTVTFCNSPACAESYAIYQKDANQSKKKTELCKVYSLGLNCPYGDSCSFAHGYTELRTKSLVPARYKTKKCREFYGSGYCRFGTRCQFLHSENEKNECFCLKKMRYTQILSALESSLTVSPDDEIETLLEKRLNLPQYKIRRLGIFEAVTKSSDN